MSAAPLWWARLNTESPRYPVWREILASDEVPLKSPGSFRADLGQPVAEAQVECYDLDIRAMKGAQKQRLAEWVARRFGTTIEDAFFEMDSRGYPIRAEDVSVAFSLRAFI